MPGRGYQTHDKKLLSSATSMADGERDNLVFEKYVVMFIDYYGCLPASTYSAYSNKAENEL